MSDASSLVSLGDIADHIADQARYFLCLNPRDSDLLIGDVIKETNIERKITKLLRLLLDRLSSIQKNYQMSSLTHSSKIDEQYYDGKNDIITELSQELTYEKAKRIQMKKINEENQNKITALLKEINSLRKSLACEPPSSGNVYKNKYNQIKEKYEQLKHDSLKTQTELTSMKEKITEFTTVIEDLQNQINNRSTTEQINDNTKESKQKIKELEYKNAMLVKELKKYKNQNTTSTQNLFDELSIARGTIQKLKGMISNLTESLNIEKQKESQFSDNSLQTKSLQQENQNLKTQVAQLCKEKAKLEEEKAHLQASQSKTLADSDLSQQRISVLRTEIATLSEEKQKLQKELDKYIQRGAELDSAARKRLCEKDAIQVKLNDIAYRQKTTQDNVEKLKEENKRLQRECVRLETHLTKTKDELFHEKEKVKNFENDSLTVRKFGFLLADAVGSYFNPTVAETELERLIEVARFNHNEIVNSVRTPLDPYSVNHDVSTDYEAVNLKFENLSNQIASLHY